MRRIRRHQLHRNRLLPQASISQLPVPKEVWWELTRRLVLLFLGGAHLSSEVHDRVIASLDREGERSPSWRSSASPPNRRETPCWARTSLALGRAMIENMDAQSRLHADLVSPSGRAAVAVAAANGALGWKVNGAGGEGGSLTILCGPESR